MKASAKDLRFKAKALLDAVARGEEVIITFRGQPRAKLVPHEEAKRRTDNELFGIWEDNDTTQDVDAYVRNLRKGRG